jgi:hypothetical protein
MSSAPQPVEGDPKTTIIRRHPTGSIPAADEGATGHIGAPDDESQTGYIPRARPVTITGHQAPSPKAAIATAVASILSGWATAVIATDLITGWWASDRLFCVAVGFLSAVSAAATIAGLIAVLLRRRLGRLLIVVGSVVALMIFASLFVAGAKFPPLVYAIPVLSLASIVSALLPGTKRWVRSG